MASNRKNIESSYPNYMEFIRKFNVTDNMLNDLISMAGKLNVALDAENYERDKKFIITMIKAQMARDIWGNEGYYATFIFDDDQFNKAITLFEESIQLMKLNK